MFSVAFSLSKRFPWANRGVPLASPLGEPVLEQRTLYIDGPNCPSPLCTSGWLRRSAVSLPQADVGLSQAGDPLREGKADVGRVGIVDAGADLTAFDAGDPLREGKADGGRVGILDAGADLTAFGAEDWMNFLLVKEAGPALESRCAGGVGFTTSASVRGGGVIGEITSVSSKSLIGDGGRAGVMAMPS